MVLKNVTDIIDIDFSNDINIGNLLYRGLRPDTDSALEDVLFLPIVTDFEILKEVRDGSLVWCFEPILLTMKDYGNEIEIHEADRWYCIKWQGFVNGLNWHVINIDNKTYEIVHKPTGYTIKYLHQWQNFVKAVTGKELRYKINEFS